MIPMSNADYKTLATKLDAVIRLVDRSKLSNKERNTIRVVSMVSKKISKAYGSKMETEKQNK